MYTPTQRLMRSRTDKMIAGVAGGIAQYLAIDPVIVRLAFVALCFTGVGVLLYPVLWLVMPVESSNGRPYDHTMRGMPRHAARVDDDVREVFVAPGSSPRRARFDPMTGQPIEPEDEIPINNLDPDGPAVDPQARRNQLLGTILLSIGAFILLRMVPHVGPLIGQFLFPTLLIVAGILLLRRGR